MATIEQARREVQSAFERARTWSESDKKRSLWVFERELWTRMLALGRALMALFLARQAARPRATEYRHDGVAWQLDGERSSEIGTRFGKVPFTRRVGRRLDVRRAACDLPIDRELGLCGGFSLGVVLAMTKLCAQMAFAGSRSAFRDSYEWTPSPRATLRMVDAVGDEARPFLEAAPPPEDDGEILVLQVDGRGAPMITERELGRRSQPHWRPEATARHVRRARRRVARRGRPRRTKGKKSKNAKVAVAGVIYTLRRTPHGLEGPIHKRVYATFESHEALFVWLHREAVKRGYGRKQTIFLADGSEHIWDRQQRYFPDADVCLDWYHVVERIWSAGECLHDEGSAELNAWVEQQVQRLRRGATQAVLRELREELAATPRTGPGNKGRRERLEGQIKFFTNNLHRMNYAEFRRHDWDIGTGAVEGVMRNLIAMRLDGPGMRWSPARAERVLHLRCVLLNGQWDDFAAHIAARQSFTLAAQPMPTVPHAAKMRAAA